jgi:hypothetical protein
MQFALIDHLQIAPCCRATEYDVAIRPVGPASKADDDTFKEFFHFFGCDSVPGEMFDIEVVPLKLRHPPT